MIHEQEYIQFLKNNNNSSDATINAYLADFAEFEAFLTQRKRKICDCKSEDVRHFLLNLADSGKSPSTLNRKMVSIRRYYEFLRINSICEKNPCTNVKVPKTQRKNPEFLSVEQIESLLSAPDQSDIGLRDKAILEIMYACGLKVSELTALNLQDVDLRIGFISCHGEKSKNRIIPMGHLARLAVMNYIRDIRVKFLKEGQENHALFLNYKGERLSRQGVWKIIQFYGKKSGVSEELNPQIIRNSFAAHMILNGADLASLQELLGNDDFSSLKIFSNLSKTRVMDVYDKTHPRA